MTIQSALCRVRDARADLEAITTVRTNAHAVLRQKLADVQAATAAAESCDLDAAVDLANARSTAAVVADAARRGADAADQKHAKAVRELADAEYAARQAAYAILATEASDLVHQISRDELALKAKRQRLNSIRDLPDFPPSAEIAVAVGDGLNTPVNQLAPPSAFNTPVNQMGVVETSVDDARYWHRRVAELLSPEGNEVQSAA